MENVDPKLIELISKILEVQNNNDLKTNIMSILTIIIPVLVSILVIYWQNKNNLKLKKIDVLLKSKEELRSVRNFIVNYNIQTDPSQTLSQDQYNAKLLDAAILRMRQMLNVSEHLPQETVNSIKNNYNSVMVLIGKAKSGINIDNSEALRVIKALQALDPKMLRELESKIREFQSSIDTLTK